MLLAVCLLLAIAAFMLACTCSATWHCLCKFESYTRNWSPKILNTWFVSPASRHQWVFWLMKQRSNHLVESTQIARVFRATAMTSHRQLGGASVGEFWCIERSGRVSSVLLAPFVIFVPPNSPPAIMALVSWSTCEGKKKTHRLQTQRRTGTNRGHSDLAN